MTERLEPFIRYPMNSIASIKPYALPVLWTLAAAGFAAGAILLDPSPPGWLLRPWDDDHFHHLSAWAAWHARFMVVGWGILVPVGILAARYFKVVPGQDWPRELDRKAWWNAHRLAQYGGYGIALIGLVIALSSAKITSTAGWAHAIMGWFVMAAGALQIASALFRGSKGAPGDPALGLPPTPGDHYNMTPHRVRFEYLHKFLGLVAAIMAVVAIVIGLYIVNAPRWMWLVLLYWWTLLALCAHAWQRAGRCIDTYQAIWGTDLRHPGNVRRPIGLGVRQILPDAESAEWSRTTRCN